MIIAIVSIVLASAVIGWRLVKGIEYMQENHPEYRGDDLFDEDLKDWDITLMDGLEDEEDKQDE